MASVRVLAGFRALRENGAVCTDCTLTFKRAGTTTPLSVYTDKDLSQGATAVVSCDSGGYAPDIFVTTDYGAKVIIAGTGMITQTIDYLTQAVAPSTFDNSFFDPGADRLVGWNEAANSRKAVTPDTGLSLSGDTLSLHANLAAIANAGASAANKAPYYSGSGSAALHDETPASRATQALTNQPLCVSGRLTLTSGSPIMPADVTAATTIYYTPYVGNLIDIYDGTQFLQTLFAELSLALDSDSGHTGYHQSGKNFDLFVISDSGTVRLGSGPAWTDDTTRSAAVSLLLGRWTNTSSITIRFGSSSGNTVSVAAGRATLVGTFRASANGQTEWSPNPSAASGGSNNKLFLDNAYNGVRISALERESASSWNYTTATWRPYNGATSNVNNRIAFVSCLPGKSVEAVALGMASNSLANIFRGVAIALDSTTSPAGLWSALNDFAGASRVEALTASHAWVSGIGYHYAQMLEVMNASGTGTFYGQGALGAVDQAGLRLTTTM